MFIDLRNAQNTIIAFIKEKAPNGVVVGMSGGVDSSLVTALCVEALGKDKVLGLMMPAATNEPEDTNDAVRLAVSLGIDYKTVDIEGILSAVRALVDAKPNSIASSNIVPRMRMTILYHYANSLNRIVAGTGNRSELLTGYFTKYGDGGVDILPIGDLYKTEVFALAKEMKIPDKIISKPPSAGLWHGQTDEEELGIRYAELDKILAALFDEKKTPQQVSAGSGIDIELVQKVLKMHEKNSHKLERSPVARVR